MKFFYSLHFKVFPHYQNLKFYYYTNEMQGKSKTNVCKSKNKCIFHFFYFFFSWWPLEGAANACQAEYWSKWKFSSPGMQVNIFNYKNKKIPWKIVKS